MSSFPLPLLNKPIALSSLLAHDEKALLQLLAQGSQHALTVLYRSHWQSLFLSAYNILKDKKACEDIVQETFLQLWLRRENLAVRSSVKTYLSAAVRYQVFHYLRNKSREPMLTEKFTETAKNESSDAALLQKDFYRKVAEAVDDLPEKCRLIYRLSREEHLSHKEIAQRLNISCKTVENQLTIALRRLRLHLEEYALLSLFFLIISVSF